MVVFIYKSYDKDIKEKLYIKSTLFYDIYMIACKNLEFYYFIYSC